MKFFSKTKKEINYSDLSSKQQAKIIRKAIIGANKEQFAMVKEYEKSKKICIN